jgi:hypothetical protein
LYRNKIFTAFLIISFAFLMATACRDRTGSGKPFVIALDGPFSNLDPIGSAPDAAV